jgi:hypothetical protein
VGGVTGRRQHDHRLGLEKGGGKGIRGLVGQLSLLAARRVGSKAIGPKGRLGQNLKRKPFQKKI